MKLSIQILYPSDVHASSLVIDLDGIIVANFDGDLAPAHVGYDALVADLVAPPLPLEGVVVRHHPLLVLAEDGVEVITPRSACAGRREAPA